MPDSADTIYTERLDLVTFTAKFLHASLGGELAAAEQFLDAGLPGAGRTTRASIASGSRNSKPTRR